MSADRTSNVSPTYSYLSIVSGEIFQIIQRQGSHEQATFCNSKFKSQPWQDSGQTGFSFRSNLRFLCLHHCRLLFTCIWMYFIYCILRHIFSCSKGWINIYKNYIYIYYYIYIKVSVTHAGRCGRWARRRCRRGRQGRPAPPWHAEAAVDAPLGVVAGERARPPHRTVLELSRLDAIRERNAPPLRRQQNTTVSQRRRGDIHVVFGFENGYEKNKFGDGIFIFLYQGELR